MCNNHTHVQLAGVPLLAHIVQKRCLEVCHLALSSSGDRLVSAQERPESIHTGGIDSLGHGSPYLNGSFGRRAG